MDVCGEGRAVERSHLMRLAAEGGVPTAQAGIIDQMLEQAASFSARAAGFPIRRATVLRMTAAVNACRASLMQS
jgi:serine/threonine-protein kinase HipA